MVEAIGEACSERCNKQMENDDEQTNMKEAFLLEAKLIMLPLLPNSL